MTEHLLDVMLARAASVLGLALLLGRVASGGARVALAIAGSVIVLVGTTGQLIVGTAEIAGTVSLSSVLQVARTTAFGASATTAIGTGAMLAVVVTSSRFRSRAALLASAAAAAAFVLALSAQGHAAEPHGRTFVHALHLAAASAWLGGLVVLADGVERANTRPATILAFSRIAPWLVVVMFATGIARASAHVASLAELAGDWGRLLLLKLALGAGALAFALRHRRSTLPALCSEDARVPPAFGRDLTVELVLAFCTLLAAAVLGQLPPPRD